MQAILSKIEQIELKARKLLHKNEVLSIENKELLEENVKLKTELQHLNKSKSVESDISKNMDLFSTIDNKNVDRIKEALEEYIEEVDQCIRLL